MKHMSDSHGNNIKSYVWNLKKVNLTSVGGQMLTRRRKCKLKLKYFKRRS
ncbi:MAG: hypothetical protein ACTS4T_00945 [Candidatus Hodgkinia cicadicola]